MIKGISFWAFPAGTTCQEAIKLAKEYGFESIELAFAPEDELGVASTKEQCEAISAYAKEIGIKISSLCTGMYWAYNFADPAQMDEAISLTKKYINVASWIGVDTILVIPGSVDASFGTSPDHIDYADCYSRATDAIKSLIPYAEKAGVVMALENVWNKFLLSPIEMKNFVDQFNSPFVAAYFDVGNVTYSGYAQDWIKILGSRIKRVHFKDFKRSIATLDGFVDLLAGDVDWKAVIDAFEEIGYEGFVTAEMFPYPSAPYQMAKNTSKAMDVILGR